MNAEPPYIHGSCPQPRQDLKATHLLLREKVPPRDPAERWGGGGGAERGMRGTERKEEHVKTKQRYAWVSPAKGGVSGQMPDHRQTRHSDRSIPPRCLQPAVTADKHNGLVSPTTTRCNLELTADSASQLWRSWGERHCESINWMRRISISNVGWVEGEKMIDSNRNLRWRERVR